MTTKPKDEAPKAKDEKPAGGFKLPKAEPAPEPDLSGAKPWGGQGDAAPAGEQQPATKAAPKTDRT